MELPLVFDFDINEQSLIFDKKLLLGYIDFELTDVIFKTLEDSGYNLEFKKLDKFNDYYQSGEFIGVYQSGTVKIWWDKYYNKKDLLYYLMDPDQLKGFCNNYDVIAERYISEIIEPKIKEASYSKTYITLPANEDMYSLIFGIDYGPFNVNAELTSLIIKILSKNGFSCEFERKDKSSNAYLVIKWSNPSVLV